MVRSPKAGWYPTDMGGRRYWDGAAWTSRFDPPPHVAGTPAGWHRDMPGRQRWWTGSTWAEAWIRDDGVFDVVNSVGQGIFKVSIGGGYDQPFEQALRDKLKDYPPCRIVELTAQQSMFGFPNISVVAVVEWQQNP